MKSNVFSTGFLIYDMENKPNEFLNIPERIIVGYQNRGEIPLAYVTYFRGKKIAKEASWSNWRDKKMPPGEFENIPTEGFILNKRSGGYKSGWNFRQAYCRVYDPRGFELEITIDNLMYILQECTCMPGKGLEGKFVYAWEGAQIILLPTNSPDYIATTELATKREELGLKWKDVVEGYTYRTKDNGELVYVGKLQWKTIGGSWKHEELRQTLYHSFWDAAKNEMYPINNIKNILYKTDALKTPDTAIQSAINTFKSLPVGKDAIPEEFRLIQPDQKVVNEFNDFFINKTLQPGSYIMGVCLKTSKMAVVKEFSLIERTGLFGGKPKKEIYHRSTSRIQITATGEIEYTYDTASYSSIGMCDKMSDDDIKNIMSTLTPIDSGLDSFYLEVKIGSEWYKYRPYHRIYPLQGNSVELS